MTRRGKQARLISGWKAKALWIAALTVGSTLAGQQLASERGDGFRYSRADGLQDFAQQTERPSTLEAQPDGQGS